MSIFDEKSRAERKERRLMKTSTYDALMEGVNLGLVPENSEQVLHEDLLADTIAVERRRWIERASWITFALITAGLGYLGGLYMHEQEKPALVECDVKVAPEAALVDPIILRCVGEEGELLK